MIGVVQRRPNFLLILTDQLRYPPPYESAELREFRERTTPGQQSLARDGVSFERHYPMSAACSPSRASMLTGHYPSLHGVSQTDGLAKHADSDDMFWLEHDTVPTLGDWFRAGGYRTFYKGKWHVSHAHLDDDGNEGQVQSIDKDGTARQDGVDKYLEADLLEKYGFSEWVGPEPHGLGARNTGTVKDRFTADETIDLLRRLNDESDDDQPWLTVCSLLNPHDIALFGLVALAQGLRYHPREVPRVEQAPTHDENLSTKPSCQQSYNDAWGKIIAPQPWNQLHFKFYYQLQATVDEQISRVLDALQSSGQHENTIVVFSSDHGDMQGAHGGLHEKWHCAYDEALRVPFIVSSPLLPSGSRRLETPTSHADLIPTLLGLAGIDVADATAKLNESHHQTRALVGRDLSAAIRSTEPKVDPAPILFMTDDEISEGSAPSASPFNRVARLARIYETVQQPNHIETVISEVEIEGEPHLVKFSRYHDNQQFWTAPGERDERIKGRKTLVFTEPEPDEYELYDLTEDPLEERNLADPAFSNDNSQSLQATMLTVLNEQLFAKRLVPTTGETAGYRPPSVEI